MESKKATSVLSDIMQKLSSIGKPEEVKEQKDTNIHVNTTISKQQFVEMRDSRDKGLSMPRLILPAIQMNIRAGNPPPAENNGISYLKVPLNQL